MECPSEASVVISLSCELTGYLTTSSDIQWIRDNTIITNGTKYVITMILGSSKAINSSGMMTQSIVSELTISINQTMDHTYVMYLVQIYNRLLL